MGRRRSAAFAERLAAVCLAAGLQDLVGEQHVFPAVFAAPVGDLVELAFRCRNVAELQVGFAKIFAGQHVVRIDPQRLLVVAEAAEMRPDLRCE